MKIKFLLFSLIACFCFANPAWAEKSADEKAPKGTEIASEAKAKDDKGKQTQPKHENKEEKEESKEKNEKLIELLEKTLPMDQEWAKEKLDELRKNVEMDPDKFYKGVVSAFEKKYLTDSGKESFDVDKGVEYLQQALEGGDVDSLDEAKAVVKGMWEDQGLKETTDYRPFKPFSRKDFNIKNSDKKQGPADQGAKPPPAPNNNGGSGGQQPGGGQQGGAGQQGGQQGGLQDQLAKMMEQMQKDREQDKKDEEERRQQEMFRQMLEQQQRQQELLMQLLLSKLDNKGEDEDDKDKEEDDATKKELKELKDLVAELAKGENQKPGASEENEKIVTLLETILAKLEAQEKEEVVTQISENTWIFEDFILKKLGDGKFQIIEPDETVTEI